MSDWSKQQISGCEYKQNPEHLGDEEMRHLQPDRSQQDHVHCAESNLSCQCTGKNKHPWCVILLSPMTPEQPKHVNGTHHCRNRMWPPEKSCISACRRESEGKIVSPRLASEPVVPMAITDTRPSPMAILSYRFARTAKCRPGLESHFAVSASAARSKRVLPKCRHKKTA